MILNDTIGHLYLIDIDRTIHSKTAEYTFFSSARGMFSKIDNMLGQKTVSTSLRGYELYQAFFPATMA